MLGRDSLLGMRNHKCGCNSRGCNQCCPPKRNASATGPTGAIGPTGPGGAAGPTGPAPFNQLVSCGHLTNNFDPEVPGECPLVVFRFSGVATFEEFQVAPDARGWLLTWTPIPGDTPDNQLARSAVITTGEEIQAGFTEDPPVILKFQNLPPAGPGLGPRTLFWLENAATGEPVDPCCVAPPFGSYHFARQVCNNTFNFLFADTPLPPPCSPTPTPGLAARALPTPSNEVLEDRQRMRQARRRARGKR